MASVREGGGGIDATATKPTGEVRRKSYRYFEEGDVIMAKITPCFENGKIAVARGLRSGRAFGSTEFHVLRPRSRAVDSRFLKYFLESPAFTELAIRSMAGAVGQLRVPTRIVADALIPLPPVDEQQRLVSAIEEQLSRLDDGLAEVEAADQKLGAYEVALLHAATMGRLPHGAPPQPTAQVDFDGSLPQLPLRWHWTTLESIAEVVGGVAKDAKKQVGSELVEVPYLRVANVQRGRLDLQEISTIRVPPGVAKKLTLQYGDVLMNEGGDRDKLGRGWIWEGQVSNCIHQNHVFRVRIRDGALEPKVLSWHGNTFGQSWFQREGKQTTNLASISLNRLKRLPVPIPPKDEQRAIVAEVDRCLSVTTATRDELGHVKSRAKQLRTAILAAAFTGRLPVERRVGQAGSMNGAPALI